jgi:hypothetical protein
MATRSWFSPASGYSGPPIVLSCGRHTKDGRFIPKNVRLTPGISRLSKTPRRRIPMVGDPSQDAREIYTAHLVQKRKAGAADPAADPLIGRSVALDAPCRQCGSATAIIRSAPPPHAAALHCVDCGTHRQWMARADCAAIREFVVDIAARFGEPRAISFRRATQRQGNQEATDMQKKGAFDNSNSGVLFKNDNKQSDKHADYRGEVNAAGVDYWLNGYVRTSKKGVKFIAFKLKPKQQEAAAGGSEALGRLGCVG